MRRREKDKQQEESWFPTQLIDAHSLPRGYRPSLRLRRLTQGARVFSSRFPGFAFSLPLRFSWRFFCPGASLFLAILLPWRIAFPGDSRVLAIPVFWRFPCPGDSQHVLAGRGLVVLQLQLKVRSFLVAFGAPAPSEAPPTALLMNFDCLPMLLLT